MKTILKSSLALAIFAMLSGIAFAGRPVETSGLIVPFDPAVDQNGNPIVDPVVYNLFCTPPNPVVAPDGHQVTYSEWVKATGTATIQCLGARGTRVSVHVSGLLPNGVYSVWVVAFGPGPAQPDGSNLLGVGPIGSSDGNQNHFVASATGTGDISAVTPAEVLPEIPYAIGSCLLSDPNIGEVIIAVAYHLDGQTHGSISSPDPCQLAIPLGFSFPK